MNGSPLLRPADGGRSGLSAPNTPPPPGNSSMTIDMGEDDNAGPNQALLYDSQVSNVEGEIVEDRFM